MTSFLRIATPAAALLLNFTLAFHSHAQVTVTLGERAPETTDWGRVDETRVIGELKRAAAESQRSGRPPEGMGFYRAGDYKIPKALTETTGSVFRVVVPNGRLIETRDVFGKRTNAAILKLLAKMPDRDGVGPVERELFAQQIRECERTKADPCRIFEGVSEGTAFVTGDGREIRTAAHLTAAVRSFKPIPLFLLDGAGKILFTPAQLGAVSSNEFPSPPGSRSISLNQTILRTLIPVARPLPIAAALPLAGESIYIVGHPRMTDDRGRYQASNAEGNEVAVSRGTVLGADALIERFGQAGLTVTRPAAEAMLTDALALTADATGRSTGSPVVNARGEVVALYSARTPGTGVAFPFAISFATRYLIPPGPDVAPGAPTSPNPGAATAP